MKPFFSFLMISLFTFSLAQSRENVDFNSGWEFCLDEDSVTLDTIAGLDWKPVKVPHDWSIALPYSSRNTASSTGFMLGGIGWYKKDFQVDSDVENIWIEFDGVYNNSTCWLNGEELGFRPSGYSSFAYDLTPYLKRGQTNRIVVKVDHSQFADSRWYTGSGIYRDVRLVKTSSTHIPQWGTRIETKFMGESEAMIEISTSIAFEQGKHGSILIEGDILNENGQVVQSFENTHGTWNEDQFVVSLGIQNPVFWDLEKPHLYTAKLRVLEEAKQVDDVAVRFGVRSIAFDSDRGFSLNGKFLKFKGVNLHHDAGAVGAAVPRDIWFSRVRQLKELGCNAIRTAHNPHSPDLMDACDELGMLVVAEAFDEWNIPKDKSIVYLSDNAAPDCITAAYPKNFDEWGERDLKDLIRRDFNRPSVIMWSIGNEIEWTHRYYQKASSYEVGDLTAEYYTTSPDFDPVKIRARLAELLDGKDDELLKIAQKLSKWVREEDESRFVTCGSVHPSVAFASGYADTVDILGFNYRAVEYDGAHELYPDAKIYGSENWTTRQEWLDVDSRDFVGGIFIWTGFAYKGEAGPFPRKGLNLALFDFSGVQTPRGHMFETMWKDEPKVYVGTYPQSDSEYSIDKNGNWTFTAREYDPEAMAWLRSWEWDDINEHWNYANGKEVLVQSYTNCEELELFVNEKSLGIRFLSDFEDGVIKWAAVPFEPGSLKVVGRSGGVVQTEYTIETVGDPVSVELVTDRVLMSANGEDVLQIFAQLVDAQGRAVRNVERSIEFDVPAQLELIGIDNGSEYYVGSHRAKTIETHNGRAYLALQAKSVSGTVNVGAFLKGTEDKTELEIGIE